MRERKSAFTILEILTVVAILGLLMGILVPSLSAARRHAKANACLSTLSGIGKCFAIYLNENDDAFPPYRLEKLRPETETPFINEYGRMAPRWQWFLETDMGPVMDKKKYRVKQITIQRGPDDTYTADYFDDETRRLAEGSGIERTRWMAHDVFTCPSLVDEEFQTDIRDGAYGYNYQYLGNTREDTTPGRWDNFAIGLHRIKTPALMVAVGDSRGAGRTHGRHSYTLDPPRLAVEERATRFGPDSTHISEAPDEFDRGDVPVNLDLSVYAYSPAETRHVNKANILFVDTHASPMTLSELGYELADGVEPEDVRRGTPLPIPNPTEETYTATNKLWNGYGNDPLADQQRPEDTP